MNLFWHFQLYDVIIHQFSSVVRKPRVGLYYYYVIVSNFRLMTSFFSLCKFCSHKGSTQPLACLVHLHKHCPRDTNTCHHKLYWISLQKIWFSVLFRDLWLVPPIWFFRDFHLNLLVLKGWTVQKNNLQFFSKHRQVISSKFLKSFRGARVV